MIGYIYKTTDKKTNKIYIGKHKSNKFESYNYIGSGLIISNIRNKCIEEGIPLEERFLIELIDTAETDEELNQKEIYYIDKFNSRNSEIGYNIRKGGDCGPGGPMFKGHKHSQETKDKMSESRKGSNNSNFGNRWHHTSNMLYKYDGENNPMYGKKHSNESKLKNKESHLNKIAISNKKLDKVKMIYKDDIDKYLDDGWFIGNIHARMYKNN